MAAAAHDPAFAKRAGIPQKVAKEFNHADTGTKLLSRAMKRRRAIYDHPTSRRGKDPDLD